MIKKKITNNEVIESPYLNARREWNERYGNYISSARNWRVIAILCLSISICCVAGLIYFAGQNKLIPYVVQVDQRGHTVDVYQSTKIMPADPRVIKAQLAQFIRDVRTVSADMTVEKAAIYRLYTHIKTPSQAATFVNSFFAQNSPFKKAENRTVAVDILQLLPLSDKTWQVEWSEQEFGRDGKLYAKHNYTATMTISVGNQVDEKTILNNPIGMMIEDLHWSEDFKDKNEDKK